MKRILFAFSKAHEIIWKHGNRRFLLVPLLLSVLLGVLLVGLSGLFASQLSVYLYERLLGGYDLPEWIRYIFSVILFIVALGPCYVLFRSLVMVCYAPFLDVLSKKSERLVVGSESQLDTGFWASLKRPLLMTGFSVSVSIALFFLGLIVGLIPVIGALLTMIILFPLQMVLSSVAYIDPYFERQGLSVRESLALMRRSFGALILFGTLGLLMTLIPLVGWFVGPTYSVVAGIVFGIKAIEEQRTLNIEH